jgi:HK97 family phage major capsid protein
MREKIQKAYNEATELYGRMKAITDEFAGKEWPTEKSEEFDRLSDAFDKKTAEAERLEQTLKRGDLLENINAPSGRLGAGGLSEGKDQTPNAAQLKAVRQAFRGEKGNALVRMSHEQKDLSANIDSGGGYLLGPSQMVTQMIQFVDDEVFLRRLGTVFPVTTGESLGAVALDADIEDANWTVEIGTGTPSTVEPFGKRELKPSPLAKLVKISKTLIRRSAMDVENLVIRRMGYKFGVTEEKAFLTGSGSNQPLGLFTPSTFGISTGRDVTAGSATTLTGDDFIEAKHTLKGAYWNRPSTRWIVSRNVLKAARKMKDTTNNYVWAPGLGPGGGLTGGLPATLVDVPYAVSEYAPGSVATGLYVALIGDLSYYWIADAMNLEIQVLVERYADTNQNGYIGRQEVDGMPVLEEAFVRLKMA